MCAECPCERLLLIEHNFLLVVKPHQYCDRNFIAFLVLVGGCAGN